MAENQYKIELGIDLNDSQLSTVKKVLNSIEEQKREVIYDVDFNIKNVNKLTKVGQEIDEIKAKLKELDDVGSLGKGKSPISIDSKSLETSLNKIHDSIKKLQNAFGRVDSNKGVQSLLTTVNKIRKSLESVTTQFESLNKNLSALSSKDFSLNFDFSFGKSSAKNPEQAMKELKMLKKEIEEYQKYFSKFYSLDGKNTDPINRLMLQHNQRNQIYMLQLQQSMNKGSDAQRIAAAKEYIKVIKDTAKAANIALEPVEFKLAESSEFIRVRNEASETEKQLKELFSGGIDATKLHQDLTNIAEDLRKIQEFVSNVSKDNHIDGLTQSFNKLSETLERLSSNLVLTKDKIDAMSAGSSSSAVSSAASDIVSATDRIEKESADSANIVVQNEKKKQQAYRATADAVVYHAGVVSKLNKAETNGRFYGNNRGTGYFGTGHYFLDAAHKHELDNDKGYNKLPYTSIDISQYDNLFRVTSDKVGSALHDFLANLTRFTQGSDDFNVDELFLQFKNVFGDTIMDIKEFGSRLDQLKSFMTNSSFADRSDSVSTQFMKSLGYGGVDTRGTKFADTRYGTVIYDLKEESILQANITDELQKQGQMLEKINYEKGQAFDKDTDAIIQQQLDEQAKRKEIADEYRSSFDTTNLDNASSELENAKNRLTEIDSIVGNLQYGIDNADKEVRKFVRDMSELGLDMSDEEIKEHRNRMIEGYQGSIDELLREKVELQSKIPALEETYNKENRLSQEAYEQAKQVVEQRRLEARQALEAANTIVQGEERKQQALEQTADAYDSVARKSAQSDMSSAFKEVDVKVEATEEQISNLKVALHNLGFDRSSIDAIIKSFDELEISVQKITTRLNDNGSATLTVNGIDQYGQNISASKSVHKRLDSETSEISDWSVTVTKSFKETEESFKRLKSLAKEMGDIDIKIANLEASGDIDGANSLKRILNDLETEYKELYAVTEKNLSTDQLRELEKVFANTTGEVREFKNELANAADIKELTSGLEKLKSITKEINNLKIDIFKFEDLDNIERASNQLNELENEAAALRAELQQKFNITSFDEIDDIARKGEEALNNLVIKVAEAKAKLSNDIVLDIKAGSFDDDISKIDDKFDRLSGASKELRDSIQSVKNAYQEMENAAGMGKDGDGVVDVERLIRANKEYEQALEKVNNQLRIQAREEKAAADAQKLVDDRQVFQSKIDNWLTQNSAATKKFGASMTDLRAKAESCDRVTLNHLEKQFKKLDNAAENAGLKAQSFVDRIKSKFKEYAAYLSAAEVFMYAEQALRSMFEQVKLVDSAMTELKKVTNETDAAYSNFLGNASSRAKEIGTTIDGLVSSTADFARLGYNMSEAANLAEVANIYAVVGDDIDSVETATASLISTMTAFGEEASNSMSIVDKFNAVGNNFAISSGGIGEALERSASSMAAANNTLDETIALITAANTVVQDADAVGRLMPT